MKSMKGQQAMRAYIDKLRSAAKIEAPGFPSLLPEETPAAKSAVKAPPKTISSKPVEVKPAAKPAAKPEAKPAEAKPAEKPAAKPAEKK